MDCPSPIKVVAWMAAGALVIVAGGALGSPAGRRNKQSGAPEESGKTEDSEQFEDLVDRPVAQAILSESIEAVHRIESLAGSVAALEARMQALERSSPASRLDEIWQRVLQMEERLGSIEAERQAAPSLDALVAEAGKRLSSGMSAIESRVEQQQAAIEQLQADASQTSSNLQRMVAAVENLTDQISRILPPVPLRLEPKRETTAAAAAG
jgi:chromosome segregation ATPase